MIINRILNCVSEDRCFDELKAEVASLSDFTQKLIQEAVINGDSGVTCSKSIKYNPYKAVSQSNNKASTIIFPLKAKALVTLQIMMNLSKHDEFDTDQKFSFEISRSRPSTPLSSPLRSFSPLLLIETFSRKSLTYGKLPLEPIKLTVLKLDGSSFGN
ncbi:uncharacterized protein [Rutidosis leptorrhynchoides]|uniref:uncharacterized protein n=1 Tax=Rutidosis leptorrhynchoides TaxID=125765 RepID=UPI003A991E2A